MRRTVLALVVLVPLLGGCSASTGSSSSAGSSAAKSVARPAGQPATEPRVVVRTARIEVRVKDVSRAADDVTRLAAHEQGRIDGDERDDAGDGRASLVVRVPPEAVERTLGAVSGLGKETLRTVTDTDVTTDSVDVASRVATQRASVERVRALLARAETLADITRIEGELTKREADLESLQARQKALSGQVQLATITVTLTGSGAAVGPVRHAGFSDGLSGGWHALVGTVRAMAVVVGALLPWSWIVVLALLGRVAWRRWRVAAA